MRIIFHDDFRDSSYATDSAAAEDRMECIVDLLLGEKDYHVLEPQAAEIEDALRAHTEGHLKRVGEAEKLFRMALLSAGGAIAAAQVAFDGEPSFACIRPPGHHASRASGWGYCYLNNMGMALLKLRSEGKIRSAFVLDFDAHTGDGNIDVLSDCLEIKILNPVSGNRKAYLEEVQEHLSKLEGIDIVAASAGFDAYEKDVGRKLKRFDFYHIGLLLKKFSRKLCNGRRFAILEGGYYLQDLGRNVPAFCQGFE